MASRHESHSGSGHADHCAMSRACSRNVAVFTPNFGEMPR
ncbi:hypothetical protein RAJCM14343_5886 [Rhodococcus aetherivorans]|uniref:Uncharacterized protein n=1 Tax=Rhodococcus aetherivorans TaxID=191292 RepID=A0ABQ0YW54_9NOCA|nr:hypothetical protein RAJCM14343_5886 [Rhodococcus aetherivorans]CCW10703.1 hypothetical protein EBESD8_12340 [Rhodococcus aetherivorans]